MLQCWSFNIHWRANWSGAGCDAREWEIDGSQIDCGRSGRRSMVEKDEFLVMLGEVSVGDIYIYASERLLIRGDLNWHV